MIFSQTCCIKHNVEAGVQVEQDITTGYSILHDKQIAAAGLGYINNTEEQGNVKAYSIGNKEPKSPL
jgi:hypothetical protein